MRPPWPPFPICKASDFSWHWNPFVFQHNLENIFKQFKPHLCIPVDTSTWDMHRQTSALGGRYANLPWCVSALMPITGSRCWAKNPLTLVIQLLKKKWSMSGCPGMWTETALDCPHSCGCALCTLPFFCRFVGQLSMTLSSQLRE